jgi:Bacterial Ig-like domain (group 3)
VNPSVVGQEVVFTADVTAPGYAGTPAGTVTFSIDGQNQAPVKVSVVGGVDEAQLVTSALTLGHHSVTAAYSGDSNVSPSSGSLPTQTVNPTNLPSTLTTLTASLNASVVGQPVTFTAIVTAPGFAGTPTGTVTFTIDGQAQTPVALSVVGGADLAQFVTSALAVGQHSVAAAFSGDSSFASDTVASPLVQVVDSRATKVTASSSASPSSVGQPLTFTATVTPSAGEGDPTGSVTFIVDGKVQTPVPLELTSGGARAVIQISNLSAGEHTVSASYSGDATDSPSSLATPLVQTVVASTDPAPMLTKVQRFGIHREPTVLVLTFSAALDPESATNLENYVLVGPAGKRIKFKSVSYDASAHAVTLRPHVRVDLHRTYRLTVSGADPDGIAGTNHALLDGAGEGQSGTDFVTTLTWRNVVLTPAQTQWVHEQSWGKPRRQG